MLQRSLSDESEISTANSPPFRGLSWLCYITQAAILAKRSRYQPPVVFALINCTKCQLLLARVQAIKDSHHLAGHDFDKGN